MKGLFGHWYSKLDPKSKTDLERVARENEHDIPVADASAAEEPDHGLDTIPGNIEDAVSTRQRFEYLDIAEEEPGDMEPDL